MKRGKKIKGELTPASLGLADDVKLSASYANSRIDFKTVSDVIIGYYVAGGSQAPVRIAPIYRAEIWIKEGHGKTTHVNSSHEIGDYYNPQHEPPDVDGDALAYLAATALGALERHAEAKATPVSRRAQTRGGR
jgi:hypothetical protein